MECAHLETLTWLSQADLNELVKRSSKTKNVLKCKGEALVSSLDFYRVGLLVCRRKVLGGSLGGVDDIVAMYFPLSNVQLSFLLPCSLQRHRVGLAVRLLRRAELRPLREGVRAATLRGHEQEARRLHGHQGDRSLLVRLTSNPACLQAEVQIVNALFHPTVTHVMTSLSTTLRTPSWTRSGASSYPWPHRHRRRTMSGPRRRRRASRGPYAAAAQGRSMAFPATTRGA